TPGPVDLRSVAETPRVGPATAVIGSGHLPPRGSGAEQVNSRVFLWGAGSMSDTRWLDDGEQQTWRSFLAAVHMMEARLDRQLRRDSGMPHAYFHALVALAEAPEREMTMTELARLLRSSQSRLSHAAARLEEDGLIRRFKRPGNRRTTIVALTDRGMSALEEA